MLTLEELLQTKAICDIEYPYVLFHGTPEYFEQVNIDKSRTYTDFGKGFYLTTIFEQAVEWAGKKRYDKINVKGFSDYSPAYVLKFELIFEKFKNLKIKVYEGYTEEWFNKIYECRIYGNNDLEEYDVTIGPMADNDIYMILKRYEEDEIDKEETLELLKFEKINMQIAFHTNKSLKTIKYINNVCEFY